jgi:hypothetical protein
MPSAAGERPRTVAIVQSSYIPWKGYFDLINAVDAFTLYDDVQYTRRDWRNRNKIKTRDGLQWLTIPVETKGNYEKPIREIRISDPSWPRRHFDSIRHSYARSPYFAQYEPLLEDLYLSPMPPYLTEVNFRFLTALCGVLGITTPITRSDLGETVTGRNERLIALCRHAGAERYLSGPAARDYLDETLFAAAGIKVAYADYSDYPEYPQRFPPFDHHVSIVDLILNVGPEARHFMKSFARLDDFIVEGAASSDTPPT